MTTEVTPAGSGLVVVDKPAGMTSHDVVARVRRLAGTRKVGHAGTLDPMATGVLVLGVNKATRLLGHLALTEKGYDATVRLGSATTTDDAEGEPLPDRSAPSAAVTEEQVVAALAAFRGDISQRPSAVSAIKIDGQRAYKRVRSGEDVEIPARPVTIHSLEVSAVRREGEFLDVDLSVRCSSGTYIRAIARDLGEALGVGGHLTALRRTSVGTVGLDEATPLADMQAAGRVTLMTMPEAAQRFFPTVQVDVDAARDIGFGRPLDLELPDTGPVAVLGPDGALLALYSAGDDETAARARPVAVLA